MKLFFRIRRRKVRRQMRRGYLAGAVTEYVQQKSQALQFVQNRLVHLNQTYGFVYQRVSVKNQATRWGSCSKHGNLNFHYRIIQLPPHLADYIIVHELCHLRELNHSHKFWELVAQSIPDYKMRRKQLRTIFVRST